MGQREPQTAVLNKDCPLVNPFVEQKGPGLYRHIMLSLWLGLGPKSWAS